MDARSPLVTVRAGFIRARELRQPGRGEADFNFDVRHPGLRTPLRLHGRGLQTGAHAAPRPATCPRVRSPCCFQRSPTLSAGDSTSSPCRRRGRRRCFRWAFMLLSTGARRLARSRGRARSPAATRLRPGACARCRSSAADRSSAVADRSIACPRFVSRASQVASSSRTARARFELDSLVGQGDGSGIGVVVATIDEGAASGANAAAERACRRLCVQHAHAVRPLAARVGAARWLAPRRQRGARIGDRALAPLLVACALLLTLHVHSPA